MKITKNNLKRMIMEELKFSMNEHVSQNDLPRSAEEAAAMGYGPGPETAGTRSIEPLLDPNNPLGMSKELEGFREEATDKALKFLRAGDDQKIELEIMNLVNSQMAPGTEMSDLVGRMLADMYEKGLRGQNTDEFQRS